MASNLSSKELRRLLVAIGACRAAKRWAKGRTLRGAVKALLNVEPYYRPDPWFIYLIRGVNADPIGLYTCPVFTYCKWFQRSKKRMDRLVADARLRLEYADAVRVAARRLRLR